MKETLKVVLILRRDTQQLDGVFGFPFKDSCLVSDVLDGLFEICEPGQVVKKTHLSGAKVVVSGIIKNQGAYVSVFRGV